MRLLPVFVVCVCACWDAPDDDDITLVPPPAQAPAEYFTDVADWAGLETEALVHGGGFVDLNEDGFDDLVLPIEPGFQVYLNRGDGSFETGQLVPTEAGSALYAYALDLTGDGRDDLLLVEVGLVQLHESVGDGTVTPRPDILRHVNTGTLSAAVTFADFDGSGRFDLFLGRSIEVEAHEGEHDHNAGPAPGPGPTEEVPAPDVFMRWVDGKYVDVAVDVGLDRTVNVLCAGAVDLNADGRVDLLIGTQHQVPDVYYQTGADGSFTDVSDSTGILEADIEKSSTSAMGYSVSDIDQDGDLDLFVTDHSPDYGSKLYEQTAPGQYRYATQDRGLGSTGDYVGWGNAFYDFDNDGDEDLFIANGERIETGTAAEPNQLFLNDGAGNFSPVTPPAGTALTVEEGSNAAAFADIDHDGDIDVLVLNEYGVPSLLRNDFADGHWLQLRPIDPALSPAVGAIVEVGIGPVRLKRWVMGTPGYGGSSTHWVHFGLGDFPSVDTVTVTWPDGTAEQFGAQTADRFVTLRRGEGQ